MRRSAASVARGIPANPANCDELLPADSYSTYAWGLGSSTSRATKTSYGGRGGGGDMREGRKMGTGKSKARGEGHMEWRREGKRKGKGKSKSGTTGEHVKLPETTGIII